VDHGAHEGGGIVCIRELKAGGFTDDSRVQGTTREERAAREKGGC
jgi:hypothetical protein